MLKTFATLCHIRITALCEKSCDISSDEDEQYKKRQKPCHIQSRPFRELHTGTGIRLVREVLPAPAVLAGTEEQVYHAAQREQVVAYDEVFQIHDAADVRDGEAAPCGKSKYARQRQHDDHDHVDPGCFLSRYRR